MNQIGRKGSKTVNWACIIFIDLFIGFVASHVLEESKHVNPDCFSARVGRPKMTNTAIVTRCIRMKSANSVNSE